MTPPEAARRQAGWTLEQAAKIARLHPRRLRSYELHGGATDATARRLCHFYQAGADVFHALLFGPCYQQSSSGGVAALSPSTPEAAGADFSNSGVAAPGKATASRRYRPPKTPVLTVVPPLEGRS